MATWQHGLGPPHGARSGGEEHRWLNGWPLMTDTNRQPGRGRLGFEFQITFSYVTASPTVACPTSDSGSVQHKMNCSKQKSNPFPRR